MLVQAQQKLADRLRNRKTVDRSGSAADFIDEQQTALRAAPQDIRRFGHLKIKCRLTRCQIVAGADTREDPIDDAEFGGLGRDERANLRHDRQQRGLAQIRGLAAHIRAGKQNEAMLARAQMQSRSGRSSHAESSP